MNKNGMSRKTRELLLFVGNGIFLLAAMLFVFQNSGAFHHAVLGDVPSYSMTLNESNQPSSLNTSEFHDGQGYVRSVLFQYENAKLSAGNHVVLDQSGQLYNSPTTRITDMTSIKTTFIGEATLAYGPTPTTINLSSPLTSDAIFELTSEPYFFAIKNAGASALTIETIVITFTCSDHRSTIEFVTNCETSVDYINQEHGTVVAAPADLVNYGYTLEGWFTEPTFVNQYTFTTMPVDDLILYAKWGFDESSFL